VTDYKANCLKKLKKYYALNRTSKRKIKINRLRGIPTAVIKSIVVLRGKNITFLKNKIKLHDRIAELEILQLKYENMNMIYSLGIETDKSHCSGQNGK
jgi:hypothetical protein